MFHSGWGEPAGEVRAGWGEPGEVRAGWGEPAEAGPLVDGSGPTKIVPLRARLSDSFSLSVRLIYRGREDYNMFRNKRQRELVESCREASDQG